LKRDCSRILDVRTSAHRPGLRRGSLCLSCSGFIGNRKPPSSEADLPSSGRSPRKPICTGSIHRNEPNRPHISSETSDFKERETKQTEMRRNSLARPRLPYLRFFLAPRLPALQAGPSGAPAVHLCAAGEGVFRLRRPMVQEVFLRKAPFFHPLRRGRKNPFVSVGWSSPPKSSANLRATGGSKIRRPEPRLRTQRADSRPKRQTQEPTRRIFAAPRSSRQRTRAASRATIASRYRIGSSCQPLRSMTKCTAPSTAAT